MSPRVAFLGYLCVGLILVALGLGLVAIMTGCGPNGPGTIGPPPCPCCSLTCMMVTCGWDCSPCGKAGCKDAGEKPPGEHLAAVRR